MPQGCRLRPPRGCALLAAAACLLAGLPAPGESAGPEATPPPIHDFFAAPKFTRPQLSPDGRHIVGISPTDDHQTVVVIDVETDRPIARMVIPEPRLEPTWLLDGERRIGGVWWVNDDRLLVSVTRQGGHMSHLLLVNADGTDTIENHRRPLKDGLYQKGDALVDLLPADPSHVLLAYPRRKHGAPYGHEVRKLHVTTAQSDTVERAQPDVREWFTDASGQVRVGRGVRDGRNFILYRAAPKARFLRLEKLGGVALDPLTLRVLGLDGDSLIVASRHDGDRFAVYRLDIGEDRFASLLFAHPRVDVTGPLVTERDGTPVGVRYTDEFDRIHWFDPELRARQAEVDAALPDLSNTIESWSDDRKRFVVRSEGDRTPPTFHLYLAPERKFRLLGRHQPNLRPEQLATTTRVTIPTRDGFELEGYLTRPQGSEGRRVPFLVRAYGGPWERARRGFDEEAQFLVSRGFGVLRVNVRGSVGLGRRYEEAGYGEWSGAAQDDVLDAADWLASLGFAERDRICLYGSGYGGYSAMMAVSRDPDQYRCAISHAGISDLRSFLAHRDKYDDNHLWRRRLAGEDLEAASPLRHVGAIEVPILLSHGKQDRVVEPEQSREFALALKEANKRVIFYQWPHDGHQLQRNGSRIDFYGRLEHFLAESIGDPRMARAPTEKAPEAPSPAE